jgi:hypothetical protein
MNPPLKEYAESTIFVARGTQKVPKGNIPYEQSHTTTQTQTIEVQLRAPVDLDTLQRVIKP